MQRIWISTKITAKAAMSIIELTISGIGAVIHTKHSARKARAAFRRALAQQGLPDETADTLTSVYGEQLRKLSSVTEWMKQFRH